MNLIHTKMDEYLNSYQYHHQIPGFSATIVQNNEIVYQRNFGSTSINNLKNRINADTIFSIQNVTKSMTSMALLHLEEHTDFSLDDPIIKYLPYFQTKTGPYEKITTRHILSHTAGFSDNIWIVMLLDEKMYEFNKDLPEYKLVLERCPNLDEIVANIKTREDVTRFFGQIDLEYEPGEEWKYCTDAYVIAADVLEKVSGLSYEDYVEEHIFQPLELKRTFINPTFPKTEKNFTSYYLNTITTPIEVPIPENKLGAPASFIYSTANDLAKYIIEILDKRERVLTDSQYMQMIEPLAHREEGLSYGLGWNIKELEGLQVAEHAGSYPGVSSFVSIVPEYKLGMILLCNMDQIQLVNISNKLIRMWKKEVMQS